jgi:DDE family transposase
VPWSSAEIVSPHDPEARFSHKPGKVEWVGYKDHQTETCDEERPNLIVHVVTTPAPEQDVGVVDAIHDALADQRLAPAEHLLDSGYVTPEAVHRASTAHAIVSVGPVRQDPRAVERPGFTKEDFQVNWQARTVTCPQGTVSPEWKPTTADRKPRLSALFRRADCRNCTVRQQCRGNVGGKAGTCSCCPSRCRRSKPGPSATTDPRMEAALRPTRRSRGHRLQRPCTPTDYATAEPTHRGVAVHPGAGAVEQDRPVMTIADRSVDRTAHGRWQRDDLGALADHG